MANTSAVVGAVVVALAMGGCLPTTSEEHFIGQRSEDYCEGIFQVCKGESAGCVLETYRYLSGAFPGERKFLVRTEPGDWKIRILLYLKERMSPGTETIVNWYEPGCTDEYEYRLSRSNDTKDLFEQAGRDQVFWVEQPVVEPGDHLVTVWSDAVCRYHLRVEIHKQEH
jgi:hypothetical protein